MSGKKIAGIILAILGLIGAYYYIGGYFQVKNAYGNVFGVADETLKNYWPMMVASVAAVLLGLFLILKGDDQASDGDKSSPNSTSIKSVSTLNFDGEKSLSNDAYKIYLSKKYAIEKNDVLGKIIANNKLFENIDEALKYLDFLEQKEMALVREKVENEKNHQELLRQDELKVKEQKSLEAIEDAEKRKIQDVENEITQTKFKKFFIIAILVVAVGMAAYFGYGAYSEHKLKSEQMAKFNKIKEVTTKFGLIGADGVGIKWAYDCNAPTYHSYVNKEDDKTGNWIFWIEPPQGALTFTSQDIRLNNDLLEMKGAISANTTEKLKGIPIGTTFILTLKKVKGGIRIIDYIIGESTIAKNGIVQTGNGGPTETRSNCSNLK